MIDCPISVKSVVGLQFVNMEDNVINVEIAEAEDFVNTEDIVLRVGNVAAVIFVNMEDGVLIVKNAVAVRFANTEEINLNVANVVLSQLIRDVSKAQNEETYRLSYRLKTSNGLYLIRVHHVVNLSNPQDVT